MQRQEFQAAGENVTAEALADATPRVLAAVAGTTPAKHLAMQCQAFQAAGGNVTVEALADATQRVLAAVTGTTTAKPSALQLPLH